MNAKRCKRIRQHLRGLNVDPRQTDYDIKEHPMRGRPAQLQVILYPRCGRAIYHYAKRAA